MELLKMMSVKQLFEDEKQYIVPIYQRDYAWTHKEAKQLIDDIRDYIVDNKERDNKERDNKERSYYIGSLVVYSKGDNLYEVVDGQQRLTTLTIMLRALKSKGVEIDSKLTNAKLSFEHRAQSTNSLKNLGEGDTSNNLGEGDTSIDEMYHILQKANYGVCNEFTEYLLEKVKILLVEIPKDTDLNHYFEIMNTRGEQLEKHEVLKARLMSMLKYDDEEKKYAAHSLFNIIWEACSDMNSYAMMNIKADIRNVLYGDSNVPLDSDFDSMLSQIIENGKQSGANNKITIEKIEKEAVNIAKVIEEFWGGNKNLEGYEIARDAQNNEKPERFKSIIDFQNFLLQTLSIYVAKKHVEDEDWRDIKIILDDKQLLQSFEKVEKKLVDEAARADFAKEFIVFLLRVRSLFDIYVLKSDSKDDNDGKWKIQKYDRNNYNYVNTFESKSSENEDAETNSDLEMIQSMFHFSYTSNTYKNWLNDTLKYIEKNEKTITSGSLFDWLWKLAKTHMLDNYLKKDKVYDFSRLDRGCEVENFVFNFYDFVVWKKNKDTYKDFKFTYRTSVEHFYPQHPEDNKYLYEGNSESVNDPEKEHQKIVNSFGNLCLITSSMNSRFSNLMPNAKYDQYGADNKDVGKQSIKLMQMFEMAKEKSTWNKKTIEDFTKDCKKTLADELGIEDNCHSEKTCSNPS